MPDFSSPKNSLPDLMPLEEDRSVQLSLEELSAIRVSLMETSWRTKEIVKVLERNNRFLERDLEKITNLKRRLRRSIGIIPGMPGKAGALLGVGVGMGLIPPMGGWKMPEIPPIGKPQPPLTPEPAPVYVPVDVPQPVPIDIPVTVPDTVPDVIPDTVPDIINVPDLVPDSIDIPDPRAGWGGLEDILNPDGTGVIIGDPGPEVPPVVVGKDGEVEIPHQGGELINPGALQPEPTYGMAWLKGLNAEQLWQLVKANVFEDKVLMGIIVVSVGLSFLDGPVPLGDIAGLSMILSRLSLLLKLKKLKIPAALLLAGVTSTIPSLANAQTNNIESNSSTSSSDIASLQLNTRKTDTFVIITDQPIA